IGVGRISRGKYVPEKNRISMKKMKRGPQISGVQKPTKDRLILIKNEIIVPITMKYSMKRYIVGSVWIKSGGLRSQIKRAISAMEKATLRNLSARSLATRYLKNDIGFKI